MKGMRTDLEMSQKVIIATGVLFNISRLWGDEDIEDDDEEDNDEEDDDNFVVQDAAAATIRLRGQVERERLKDRMPWRNLIIIHVCRIIFKVKDYWEGLGN